MRQPPDEEGSGMKKAFTTATLFALAVTLFNVVHSLFFAGDYDWDMDAFLYLGSRLKHGELLYFHDFETKLPFVQYLFFIPSELGGIGVWRILSFAIAVACGAIASRRLALHACDQWPEKGSASQLTLLLLSVFLMLLYSLPGSQSAQISMVAASAAYLSLAFFLTRANAPKPGQSIVIAGIFWSLAVLTRPNYLYLAILYLLFLAWDGERNKRTRGWLSSSSLFFLGASLPVIAVFCPYLTRHNGALVLFEGLKALARYSQGYRVSGLFINQFLTLRLLLFSVVLLIVTLLPVSRILRKRTRLEPQLQRAALFSALSILLLELSFLRTFFHPHYAMMLAPYATVLLFCFIVETSPFPNPAFRGSGGVKTPAVLLSLLVALSAYRVTDNIIGMAQSRDVFSANINDRHIDDQLYRFLQQSKKAGLSFLVVEAPIYHMLLDEPRIGDGHPAILKRVLLRKPALGPISGNRLFSAETQRHPCNALILSGKDLIISKPGSVFDEKFRQCADRKAHYHELHPPALAGYHIYRKTSAGMQPDSP